MLGPDDLILCSGTVPGASIRERVQAAEQGGFRAVSLFLDDYRRAGAEGWSDTDLRHLLDDSGLVVAELDPLMNWIPGLESGGNVDAQGEAFLGYREEDFYAAANALGARSLNVVLISDRAPAPEEIAEAFGSLCDRAAEHGLLVHLEFLPWTQIPSCASALEIVERADRPNGGLMFDTWHHFRSGADDAKLRDVPARRILSIQLNDAPREAEANLVDETLHRRLLPGEGDIDLVGILRTFHELGVTAPVGVEVFSDELAAQPPLEVARKAGRAVRELLKRARTGA